MDPITQGVIGAIVAQTRAKPAYLAKACVIGALAGMAPDLDVLIRSEGDPLLALEFHRHFTHSLLFIPFGGLICALAMHPLLGKRWQLTFLQTLTWCLLGYGTHGLLDAFTSYGTQLLWPLSNYRFAWDTISVIDPLFTIPILLFTLCAARLKRKRLIYGGMIWGAMYMSIGWVQHERAMDMGYALASSRGHQPIRLEVKPSFANLALWKVVYETTDRFYVDAVKPGLQESVSWPGDSVPKLDLARDLPWLDLNSQQAADIERFRWFSAGYIALDQQHKHQIVDIRYSLLPQEIRPLWGIRLSEQADREDFADYYTQRDNSRSALTRLIEMIQQSPSTYKPE